MIGVVTSPTGAVIRDILHRLEDRCPTLCWSGRCTVQGEGAAAEIAAAVRGLRRDRAGGPVPRPDLIIVARGGGSIEDLWAFNEEVVVRAIAACSIPLISAVGHETDTTLADFAADVRAPTPTAAAEMAVPVLADLRAHARAIGAADGALRPPLSRARARAARRPGPRAADGGLRCSARSASAPTISGRGYGRGLDRRVTLRGACSTGPRARCGYRCSERQLDRAQARLEGGSGG